MLHATSSSDGILKRTGSPEPIFVSALKQGKISRYFDFAFVFAADFALLFPLWLGLPEGAAALLLGEAVCAGVVVAGAIDAAGDGDGDA